MVFVTLYHYHYWWTHVNVFFLSVFPIPLSFLCFPLYLLSCGRHRYNRLLIRSAKDLKELHLCLLFYEWKTQKRNKIDSKRFKRNGEKAPHWSGNRQRCVWVSVYKHLRGFSRHTASFSGWPCGLPAEKPAPHPLQISWSSDWAVPVCSSLIYGAGNPPPEPQPYLTPHTTSLHPLSSYPLQRHFPVFWAPL